MVAKKKPARSIPYQTEVAVENIRPNDENPRGSFETFPLEDMNQLSESIDSMGGVLVPVSVYFEPKGKTEYVLIDGERRWRASKELGRETIPAIIQEKPSPEKNLALMFNIHIVRKNWDDMDTAKALRDLSGRYDTTDPQELKRLTGLSLEKIKRYQFAIELPQRWQKAVQSKRIPLNWFFEIDRYVTKPMSRKRPVLFEELGGRDTIVESFMKKRESGVSVDPIAFRKVAEIITAAYRDAGSETQSTEIDGVLADLVREPEISIDEAFEITAEVMVESEKFAKRCDKLVSQFDRLLEKSSGAEEREMIVAAASRLATSLNERLQHLKRRR